MIFYWKKKKLKKCKLFLPLNFELYVNLKDLLLFQNGLFLFYWHHFAIGTLVSVSLSWSFSWHHYDTYNCCSIWFQKPVRGDWVGCWTVLRPYFLEGRPAQSCVPSDLYLQSAKAIFFFITETVLSCALCVSSDFLSSFLTSELWLCKKWLKSRFSLAFAFARTVSVWAFSRRFCLMDGNVPKGFERCWKKFLVLGGLLAWALFFSSWTSRGLKECIMFVWGFIVIFTILRHDVELLTVLYILTYLVGSEGTDILSYVLFQKADNIPVREMNRATNHLLLARNSNCCPVRIR